MIVIRRQNSWFFTTEFSLRHDQPQSEMPSAIQEPKLSRAHKRKRPGFPGRSCIPAAEAYFASFSINLSTRPDGTSV